MDVAAQAPFQTRSLLWQPAPGAWALTVACHVVHDLQPQESPPTSRPVKPPEGEDDPRHLVEPWGPVAPSKRGAEVVVVGSAHAPSGYPVPSLLARLAVGEIDKVVRVHGDAHFTATGALVGPTPFARMPLTWARAAGGPHTSNPEGVRMGREALVDTQGRLPLPNLRPAAGVVDARDQVFEPIGFGPLRPTSPVRVARLRHHAATFSPARWMEQPLPAGIDLGYFNVAPADQASSELQGNERIALENLHPSVPRLITYLTGKAPLGQIAMAGGAQPPLAFSADTLVIDADRGQAIIVYRAVLSLDHPRREGMVLVGADIDRQSVTGTLNAVPGPARAALPFQSKEKASEPKANLKLTIKIPDPAEARARPPRATTLVMSDVTVPTAALPFVASPREPSPREPSPREPSPRPAPLRAEEITRELPAPSFAREPEAPADHGDEEPITERRPQGVGSVPPPPEVVAIPLVPSPAAPPALIAPAIVATLPAPPEIITARVPPPSLGSAAPAAVESVRPEVPLPPPSEPPPSEPPPAPPSPSLPERARTLEEHAAIDARLAMGRAERGDILSREELTEATWEEAHGERMRGIDEELDRGKKALLTRYDAAYVAALEDARGPITAAEMAKITIAVERGRAEEALGELGLPGEALMRIRRVWLQKTVKDPKLAAELRAATSAAREG